MKEIKKPTIIYVALDEPIEGLDIIVVNDAKEADKEKKNNKDALVVINIDKGPIQRCRCGGLTLKA